MLSASDPAAVTVKARSFRIRRSANRTSWSEHVEKRQAALVAIALLDLIDAAKALARGETRVGRRQPARDVLVSQQIEMGLDLVRETAVAPVAEQDDRAAA